MSYSTPVHLGKSGRSDWIIAVPILMMALALTWGAVLFASSGSWAGPLILFSVASLVAFHFFRMRAPPPPSGTTMPASIPVAPSAPSAESASQPEVVRLSDPIRIPRVEATPPPVPLTQQELNAKLEQRIREIVEEQARAAREAATAAEEARKKKKMLKLLNDTLVWYFKDGKVCGPVRMLILVNEAKAGAIPRDTQICIMKTRLWKRLDEI